VGVPTGEIPSNLGTKNLFCYLLFGSDDFLTTQTTQNQNMAVQEIQIWRLDKYPEMEDFG